MSELHPRALMLHPHPPNSNGVDLSRRRVDVLTSIDDDNAEHEDVPVEHHDRLMVEDARGGGRLRAEDARESANQRHIYLYIYVIIMLRVRRQLAFQSDVFIMQQRRRSLAAKGGRAYLA